ncbi:hypothetical protein Droror1_Dr00007106 [Drosera rotundifolia]
MTAELIDLEIHINGDHIFFLNQRIISAYSIKVKKMIKQAKKNTQMRKLRSSVRVGEMARPFTHPFLGKIGRGFGRAKWTPNWRKLLDFDFVPFLPKKRS